MTRGIVCFLALSLLSAAAAAQEAAPAEPPVTTTASPEIKAFQQIEDSWANAVNQRDQYGIELVLSPLLVDVAADGNITTRNQQVALLLTGDDKTMHLEQTVITVRMLGDIAVVNGTYVLHHRTPAGVQDEKGVFTHVFQKVRAGWLCINSQRTAVRSDAPGGKTRKSSGSKAEEPFHIPLFTKSDKNQQ